MYKYRENALNKMTENIMKHLSYSLNVIFEAALNANLFLVFNKFVDTF